MNQGHKLAKLRNRLKRLKHKVVDISPDRKTQVVDRISAIEALLQQTKI